MPDGDHHHAHGPANRGRIVLTTAAPLFVCEPLNGPATEAIVALHGAHGITAGFERALRAMAARGYLVAAPFHYFRDGGPEYVTEPAARDAYTALADEDVDVDVDAAIDHVRARLRLRPVAVVGETPAAANAVRRAGRRHPEVEAIASPEGFWETNGRKAFPA
ncbi:dienelactone hydrolase family protein [Amycolatopsis sp. NPDC005232]|uniref:dienelactone hydrolase family protein n=1 Tax=Amycolatopsis sp. NPDC005232 TaxID=3157027 RepID=UPI0033B8DBF8